jgi:hypothetical protein
MNESVYLFSNAMPIIIRMSLNALKKFSRPGCSFSIQVFVRERTGSPWNQHSSPPKLCGFGTDPCNFGIHNSVVENKPFPASVFITRTS